MFNLYKTTHELCHIFANHYECAIVHEAVHVCTESI